MSNSPIILGLMAVFTLATVGAVFAPVLLLPGWMARRNARNVQFHHDAILAIDQALERSQSDLPQTGRLQRQRANNVAALRALAPAAVIPARPQGSMMSAVIT